jgi:predicted amidohydrolase YtcJ
MHFSGGAWERMFVLDVSYPAAKNIAEVRTKLAERVATTPKGTWILARGWDEGKLEDRRLITARDVDEVSPDHPVILGHTTGHYLTANTAALRAANVTRDTRDPPGGTIDRYPRRHPHRRTQRSGDDAGGPARATRDARTAQAGHGCARP